MKDFLYMMYIESFTDQEGLFGKIVGVLLWTLTIILVLLIMYVLYSTSDFMNRAENTANGVAVEKVFVPHHSSVMLIPVGKVLMPMTQHYSDDWRVVIKVDNMFDTVSVPEKIFKTVEIESVIPVKYKVGRWSKSIKIITLYPKE